MKIRRPWIVRLMGFALACVARLLLATLRHRYWAFEKGVLPGDLPAEDRRIYVFWHENMLLPLRYRNEGGIYVLISQHADGQLIASIVQKFGGQPIRGSTRRGGIEAVRRILRRCRDHLVITPDGPTGPRRRVQPGVIYLAARLQMPIVPLGVGYGAAWRLKSWDQFVIPKPFCQAMLVSGKCLHVPPDLGKAQVESFRLQLEAALQDVSAIAEDWAAGRLHILEDGRLVAVREMREPGAAA